MRIHIKNFGPIKDFDFDLTKDLTLIYGENNVGKSYAIEVVYLILKYFRKMQKPDSSIVMEFGIGFDKQTPLAKYFTTYISHYFLNKLEKAIYNIGNFKNIPDDSMPVISIDLADFSFDIELTNSGLRVKNMVIKDTKCVKSTQLEMDNKKEEEMPHDIVRTAYKLFYQNIHDINKLLYFLPVSRSGLYSMLSTYSELIVKLAVEEPDTPIGKPLISEKVGDYFLTLNAIDSAVQTKSEIYQIGEQIENELLNGKITFNDFTKKIFYTMADTGITIEISHAASMVSELAPVVLYLKNIVGISRRNNGDTPPPLIFIEEPEAHLHPKSQIKLMEIFAKLIKAGVKIIITTHSNYMFSKLNNLILEGRVDIDKIQSYVLKKQDTGTVAKLMESDKYGIDDENFGDVSGQLYFESLALIDDINEKNEAKND